MKWHLYIVIIIITLALSCKGNVTSQSENPQCIPTGVEICGNEIDDDCVGGDALCEQCPVGGVVERCICGGVIIDSGTCEASAASLVYRQSFETCTDES